MDYKTHQIVGASVGFAIVAQELSKNATNLPAVTVFTSIVISVTILEISKFIFLRMTRRSLISLAIIALSAFALFWFAIPFVFSLETMEMNVMFQFLLFIIAVIIGSLIPDIDKSNSKLGSKVKPLSSFIEWSAGHRGIFHTPFLYLAIYFLSKAFLIDNIKRTIVLSAVIWSNIELFFIGILIGAAAHIFADLFNGQGVPLLYPLTKKKFYIIGFKMGGYKEILFRILVILLTIIYCGTVLKIIPFI